MMKQPIMSLKTQGNFKAAWGGNQSVIRGGNDEHAGVAILSQEGNRPTLELA
jgi:hypothetical protein